MVRADGTTETLPATACVAVAAGDRLVIETPGGRGFGPPAAAGTPPAGTDAEPA